ncbi:DUF5049 domain-containing protein [Pelotomaculum terephthalicicum]|uniref:DUF5049 domain-containing protein n=1 Tax=Pelotomaculum terephthalicicum TaxID=206393 RepID=UPI0035E3CDDB
MNETIRLQILAIRESGATNMFDIPRVRQEAYSQGFHELVNTLMITRPSTPALS